MVTNLKAGEEKKYLLAGNSIVTLTSVKTKNHFTYKIKKSKNQSNAYIVMVCTNYDEYQYLCMLYENRGTYTLNAKDKIKLQRPSAIAFKFVVDNYINQYKPHKDLIIQHHGVCGRCGRVLTDPTSIELGLGPECAKR
jgi:hypothetical protein